MWELNFKKVCYRVLGLILLLGNSSCEKLFIEPDKSFSNREIFEEFWTVLDERYALFEIKNLDWNEIYFRYEPQITEKLSDFQLLDIIGKIIGELKDSHTDLQAENINKYYWPISAQEMEKFNFNVISQFYFKKQSLKTINSVSYVKINESGYIYIKDFKNEITESTVSKILTDLGDTKNLIIDIRNNTGGNENYGNLFVSHLIDKTLTNKIIYYKNGKGHNSFLTTTSSLKPSSGIFYKSDVVVLINKVVYSAANSFANSLSLLPQVTLIGETTGGGGGLPLKYELSNGWVLRFSASMEFRPTDSLILDKGIPPDFYVAKLTDLKKDNVLDFALEYLKNKQ
jgi:hypothetical protein